MKTTLEWRSDNKYIRSLFPPNLSTNLSNRRLKMLVEPSIRHFIIFVWTKMGSRSSIVLVSFATKINANNPINQIKPSLRWACLLMITVVANNQQPNIYLIWFRNFCATCITSGLVLRSSCSTSTATIVAHIFPICVLCALIPCNGRPCRACGHQNWIFECLGAECFYQPDYYNYCFT